MESSQTHEEGEKAPPGIEKSGGLSELKEFATSCKLHIGTRVGDVVRDRILGAEKSIKIVSPFLGRGMVELLCNAYLRGIHDIHLITSVSDSHFDYIEIKVLKKLIHRFYEKSELKYKAILDTIFFKKEKKSRFIHEKLYIIDDEIAFLGSFNFTKAGMHGNAETRFIIETPDAIQRLIEYFDKLRNTDEDIIAKWKVADLGEKVYKLHHTVYGVLCEILKKNNQKIPHDVKDQLKQFSDQFIKDYPVTGKDLFSRKDRWKKDDNIFQRYAVLNQDQYDWALKHIKL